MIDFKHPMVLLQTDIGIERGNIRDARINLTNYEKRLKEMFEMIRLNENIETLSDSLYKMQKDLQNSKDIHKTKINQKIDEIKKEYNYIDYSIERKQLESELGL